MTWNLPLPAPTSTAPLDSLEFLRYSLQRELELMLSLDSEPDPDLFDVKWRKIREIHFLRQTLLGTDLPGRQVWTAHAAILVDFVLASAAVDKTDLIPVFQRFMPPSMLPTTMAVNLRTDHLTAYLRLRETDLMIGHIRSSYAGPATEATSHYELTAELDSLEEAVLHHSSGVFRTYADWQAAAEALRLDPNYPAWEDGFARRQASADDYQYDVPVTPVPKRVAAYLTDIHTLTAS